MNSSHPTENEIQQYTFDRSGCPPTIAEHITSCARCRAVAGSYQVLFSAIPEQPKPAFGFDLSGLVLKQLPAAESRSADRFIAGFLFVFVCCCLGIPVFLFRYYLLRMFSGISPFFVYTICISAMLILAFKILVMYKRYRKQMQLLNFQ